MQRAPADHSSFIRGKTGHVPFAPGSLRVGLHLDTDSDEEDADGVVDAFEKGLQLSKGGIQTIPPGFERGLDFDGEEEDDEELLDGQQDEGQIYVAPIYNPALAKEEDLVRFACACVVH